MKSKDARKSLLLSTPEQEKVNPELAKKKLADLKKLRYLDSKKNTKNTG